MIRFSNIASWSFRGAVPLAAIWVVAAACGSDRVDVTVGDRIDSPVISVDVDPGSVSVQVERVDRDVLEPVIDGVVSLPDGWFEMSGYGSVLHVDGDEIVRHHLTESTCTVGETFDNELDVDHVSDDGAVITLDLVGPTTDYRLVPLATGPDCDTGPDETLIALHEVFSTHYPFFDERGISWPSSFRRIEAATSEDAQALRPALAAFMVELGDGHTTFDALSIDPDPVAFAMSEITTIDHVVDAMTVELDASLGRISDLRTDQTGTVGWGVIDDEPAGDVGYLFIGGFEGLVGEDANDDRDALVEALDAAIKELSDSVDHVIVDVRFNAGGYEDLAVLAAGYFVDEETPAYRKWAHVQPDPFVQTVDVAPGSVTFDGGVTVLTSPMTASAAEVFTLAMAEVADATVVGNPSFGEFSDAVDWVLPNGIDFTMSMEVYTDLAGSNHEARGVPVDVEAPFDEAVHAALEHLS